jgi:transmembrane sensor
VKLRFDERSGDIFGDDAPWSAIAAHVRDTATDAERLRVQEWVADRPERSELLKTFTAAVTQVQQHRDHQIDAQWKRYLAARAAMPIGAASRNMPSKTAAAKRSRIGGPSGLQRVRWSAAALVLVAMTVVGWNAKIFRMNRRVTTVPLIYTTANGQRATITLSDSSTIALDVASRLEIPADYAAGNRTVRLIGRGLFTVRHHGSVPFTVLTGPEVVRVLGTSFVVRRYATDEQTIIAVRDGKVAVRSFVVAAARQFTSDPTGHGRIGPADPTQFSFATGLLVLDGVPFPQAIRELNRWYDVDIRLGDPILATQRVAGEYAAGSLTDLSDILAGTFNVRVVRTGRILTLYPR